MHTCCHSFLYPWPLSPSPRPGPIPYAVHKMPSPHGTAGQLCNVVMSLLRVGMLIVRCMPAPHEGPVADQRCRRCLLTCWSEGFWHTGLMLSTHLDTYMQHSDQHALKPAILLDQRHCTSDKMCCIRALSNISGPCHAQTDHQGLR